MQTDFEREKHWWNAKAATEEQDRQDEAINRALRWREIERHLDGVETILTVGGGTGVFSIPLATRGYQVTHLDLAPAMIEIARTRAGGLETIQFIEGNATDLRFPDRAFDLVLNMDGAISFCGDGAERALKESCRVARHKLIVTVSNRAMMIAVWTSASLQTIGRLTPAIEAMLERGEWHQDMYPDNVELSKGCTQDYLGAIRAFLPEELAQIIEQAGLHILHCGGLGSLCSLCSSQAIQRTLGNADLLESFLDLCERFDRKILPNGPGTRQRAGLIAVAQRPSAQGAVRAIRYQGAIVRDHRILLIKHRHHGDGREYWIIPGGGREAGESESHCVQREMKEETHLDVCVERLLLDAPAVAGSMYPRRKTYLCTPTGGHAAPGYEPEPDAAQIYTISEVGWFDLRDERTWDPLAVRDQITYPQLQRIRAALGYGSHT